MSGFFFGLLTGIIIDALIMVTLREYRTYRRSRDFTAWQNAHGRKGDRFVR